MDNSKLISIIFPITGNIKDEDIGIYIQSIVSQQYENIELIFVSNNWIDLPNIVNLLICKTRYTCQEYENIYAAYNIGTKLAQGEFLAFIDLENVWSPDKLTLQMAAFEDYPQLDGVFGYIHGHTNARVGEELEFKFQCINIPGYLPGTMLIRHESWKKVGKFTDRFADWYRQALNFKLSLTMLPIIVAKRRRELWLCGSDR